MSIDFQQGYFELFNLPERFSIDLARLKRHYIELQKKTHPDRFVNATSQEKRLSVQYASLLNEAYKTLSSPVKRAAYLLKLKGVDVDFEINTVMPSEFLMKQIELRERAQSVDRDIVLNEIKAKQNELIVELTKQFAKGDEVALAKAKELTRQLQFFEKLKADFCS